MADIIVIGAGVTGTAIARELSQYQREVLVLESASDVCEGTSKANSGIVHAGHDALPGTLKARLNVEGNKRMEQLSRDLEFPFKRNGSLVLCFHEQEEAGLNELWERGRKNGVEGLQILSAKQVRNMDPGISAQVYKALYAPTGGIVCPFGLNIALAENAYENGVTFYFQTKVEKIEKPQTGMNYRVFTNRGCFEAPIVINAAGVYADVLHHMVSSKEFHITARKGEYCLFDKEVGGLVSKTLFQLPTKMGKGVLVTPTVHGNLLVGPTAMEVEDKGAVNTTGRGIDQVLLMAKRSIDTLPVRSVITSFAGIRAHGDYVNHDGNNDFLIQEAEDAPGFIDVAGIESPGLTCAPAIGIYVADMVQQLKPALLKNNFLATRKGIPNMHLATDEERLKLIKSNPAFANIICRCEQVTEGEILAAIHRPLGATTVDGVKRRIRAGMGRCQAGFCLSKTVEILARELSKDISQVTKSGNNSIYLVGKNKETGEPDCTEPQQNRGGIKP